MSEKNGAVSSSGMQASPAVGAKCVKSSGSSFSTRIRCDGWEKRAVAVDIQECSSRLNKTSKFAKNYETIFNCAQQGTGWVVDAPWAVAEIAFLITF